MWTTHFHARHTVPTHTRTHIAHNARTFRDIAGDDEAFEVKEAIKAAWTKDHSTTPTCPYAHTCTLPPLPHPST